MAKKAKTRRLVSSTKRKQSQKRTRGSKRTASSKQTKKTPTQEQFFRPRGMRDLIGDEVTRYQGFFDKATEIASYYGFQAIQTPLLEKEAVFTTTEGADTDIIKEMYSLKTKGGNNLVLRPEGTAGVMRAYIQNGMHALPQPVMLHYQGAFFRHNKPQRGRYRQFFHFGLETLGSEKSIYDALIIWVILVILEESGLKKNCVLVNSIGDQTCRDGYIKALTAYYRKHINDLCPHCRQRIKKNPLRLLDCKDERCRPFKENAPETLGFLCGPCKEHFKEVLEHLDTMKVPYKIDHTLVRGLDYYSRTVFEVFSEDEIFQSLETKNGEGEKDTTKTVTVPATIPLALAAGGRYDDLAKRLKSKRDVPAVGASIGVDRVLESPSSKITQPRNSRKTKVYFIHIGYEARLKSFPVIDALRRARIGTMHALGSDKLAAQLSNAEKLQIPYALIIGQKEALENSIIIRNMQSRSQETVKIEKIAEYLKKKF